MQPGVLRLPDELIFVTDDKDLAGFFARRSGMSVRFAAALNYPIDAIANCKDRKSNASDRSWRPPIRSLAAVGLAWVGG